ncbi:MAG: basic amino acid ABC transporter substrate-binding protein [Oscillospiraceae bacterium]|jgi:polar amino acid transport system substrate-binding protein|nr:basic amino acid ABC transporter substrate-binding protein [Oscillospiraceae bacterium]
MKKVVRVFALMFSLMLIVGAFASCGTGASENILVVGTNAEFAPFESFDDDKNFIGFDIDLMKEIGKKIDREIKFENFDFDALVAAVGTRCDVAIAALTVDEERALAVDFSETYFTAKQNVIVMKDSDIASADDLKGLRIGAQSGTTGAGIAEEIDNVTFKGYDKAALAVLDLKNGNLDAVIVDRNPAAEFVKVNTDMKAIGEAFFEDEFYAVAVKKGESELLAQINQALSELKADGTYDRLVAEHIVGTAE